MGVDDYDFKVSSDMEFVTKTPKEDINEVVVSLIVLRYAELLVTTDSTYFVRFNLLEKEDFKDVLLPKDKCIIYLDELLIEVPETIVAQERLAKYKLVVNMQKHTEIKELVNTPILMYADDSDSDDEYDIINSFNANEQFVFYKGGHALHEFVVCKSVLQVFGIHTVQLRYDRGSRIVIVSRCSGGNYIERRDQLWP